MSDYNFSYSINNQTAPSPGSGQPPEDSTLWSFTGVDLVDLSNRFTLLIDRVSGKRLLVQPEVAIVLTHCETFRTLRGHAEYLVGVLPQLGGQVEPILPTLAHIRDAGLMRSAEIVAKSLSEHIEAPPLAPLKIFIITCDRPKAVERLLASIENAPTISSPHSYCLIDDSRLETSSVQNLALIDACNKRRRLTIDYFGITERNSLIEHLVTALPEQADAVRFLLQRDEWDGLPTYGISRSFALLLSVGARAVILDDDIVCEAIRSPLPNTGVQFGSVGSREAVFYSNHEDLAAHTRRLPDNPITLAARQLGMPLAGGLSSLLHGDLPVEALAGANGAFMRILTANSKIIKTQCGTWGDPGTGDGHWISSLDRDSTRRLLDSPAGVSATVEARTLWLGYTGSTLTKHGVMSQLTGYDATELLPPFFPAFRGEDQLFAYMLTTLHPDSLVLNNNWAVPHLPLEARGNRSLRGEIAEQGGMSLLTHWLGDSVDLSEGISPATRLARIAQSITELAQLSEKDLLNFGRVELAKTQSRQLAGYDQQLQDAHQHGSDTWLKYLQRGHEEILETLQREPSITELLGVAEKTLSEQEATTMLASVRRGGERFSHALRAWPDIWEAARDYQRRT